MKEKNEKSKRRKRVILTFSPDNPIDNLLWQFFSRYNRKAGMTSGFIKGILFSTLAEIMTRRGVLNIPPSSQEKEEEPQVSTSPSSQKEEEKPQVFTREMLMNLIPSDLREFYEPEKKKSEDQNG